MVGGRTYFEATVFGPDTSSFTTKGFFDKEGYEEPINNNLKNNKALLWVTIIGSILAFVLLVVLVYCCCCRKKKH